MDAYAKQGQEILQKKLQSDYESVDEVNKKIVENLVIAKKKQSQNLDAENMANHSDIAASTTSARKKDGTYFFFKFQLYTYYLDRNFYFDKHLRLKSWCCFWSLHRKIYTCSVQLAGPDLYMSL